MATLKIYLDTRAPKQDGSCPLRLAVNHHGKTVFIPLSLSLREEHWDKASQRVVGTPDKASINSYLVDRLATYGRAMREVIADGAHILFAIFIQAKAWRIFCASIIKITR